jgi:Ni/Fe-hydrogenase 1 B-type cytochrome subunit
MNKGAQYPWPIRLWHWLSALVISGLLLTVILTATLSQVTVNAKLARTILAENRQSISYQQSLAIGRAINAPYWNLHLWLGYGLAALLVFRFITELSLPPDQRLLRKMLTAGSGGKRHGFLVKLLYMLFYLVLGVTVVTGLLLSLEDRYPVLQQYALIHELHELNTWFFLLFIAAHLAGVILAESRRSKGIVSGMVGGSGRNHQ